MKISIPQRSARQLDFELSFDDPVDLSDEEAVFVAGSPSDSPVISKTPEVFDVDGENTGLRVKLTETDTKDWANMNYELWINFEGFGWVQQKQDSLEIKRAIDYEN